MKITKKFVFTCCGALLLLATVFFSGWLIGTRPRENMVDEKRSRNEIAITSGGVRPSDLVKIKEAGTYERLDYTTRTYDQDNRVVTKHANIYLPYGYDANDPDTQYPVMYLFHGYGGNAENFMGSPNHSNATRNMIDHLIRDGKSKPMIIVNASYYTANEESGKDNYDIEILENFRQELLNDLIPAVESRYHTYTDRNHRILAGFSMGGVMTISRMMDSMDYFRYYLAMSGSIYWSAHHPGTPDTSSGPWVGRYLAEKIEAQGYHKDDFYLYTAVGTMDYAKETVDKMIDSLAQTSTMFTVNNDTAAGNVTCMHGLNEIHGGSHCKQRFLFNALPVFSALMNT